MIDKLTLQRIHNLSNGFAKERTETELEKIMVHGSDSEALKQQLGILLATAYAKGYADCHESKDIQRLIF